MLIKDTGAGGSVVDQIIESSLQRIGIVAYNTAAITDAMLALCTISLTRCRKGGGSVPVLYPMSLQAALEISAADLGHYKASALDGLEVIGAVEISNGGTLLLDEEYLTVTLTHTNGANFGVKIYAIEGDQFTRSSISYEPNVVLADSPKLIQVAECYKLALPVANFTKLILNYSDGRTATYSAAELGILCVQVNDVVSILSSGAVFTLISGFSKFYCIPIGHVVSATVHYAAQTKFFAIKNI